MPRSTFGADISCCTCLFRLERDGRALSASNAELQSLFECEAHSLCPLLSFETFIPLPRLSQSAVREFFFSPFHRNTAHLLLILLSAHFPTTALLPSLSSSSLFLILGIPIAHNNVATTSMAMITGCNTCTPAFCAMAPTAKGKTQAPPPPKAAENPIAGTCICFGKSLVNATTAAGNSGPRKKPTKATAIEPPINEGTSQKSS